MPEATEANNEKEADEGDSNAFLKALAVITSNTVISSVASRQAAAVRNYAIQEVEVDANHLEAAKDPDGFIMHEALDRVRILIEVFQVQVLEHPSILANETWFTAAMDIMARMERLDDLISAVHEAEE